MENSQTLQTKEQQLQAELEAIAKQKEQAKIDERNASLKLIDSLDAQAAKFRSEALEAKNEWDKRELYLFAADVQKDANALREQLGIDVQVEVDSEKDAMRAAKRKTLIKISSMLLTSVCALIGFFVADFSGGKLEGGFFPYALKYLASIFYFVATAFGGSWLVVVVLFSFIPDYLSTVFSREFMELKPAYRIGFIVAITIALLHFLNSVVPHAN